MTALHQDLLIKDGDLALDAGRNPVLVTDRACIAQDIKHDLWESGLVTSLIAERSQSRLQDVALQITARVESDIRIEPGTTQFSQAGDNQWLLTARTTDFEEVLIWL